MSRGMHREALVVTVMTAFSFPALAQETGDTGDPGAAAEAPPTPESAPSAEVGPVAPNLAEARERVTRGEQLFEGGNYDAALVEFQQAYDIIGDHPNRYLVLYNIGRCHERSFQYDQALRFYRQFLEEGGRGTEAESRVTADIERLAELLTTVHIDVNLPRAEVWIRERLVGTAPGTVRIPGGAHTIELRAPGHLPARREVQLPAGGEESLSFTLEPLAEGFAGLHHAYFWSIASATLATLVTTVALGASVFSSHNDLSRRLNDDYDRWFVTQDDLDGIGALAVATDVMLGATVLLAVGTVVVGLLTDWESLGIEGQGDSGVASQAGLRLGAAPMDSGGTLLLGGGF